MIELTTNLQYYLKYHFIINCEHNPHNTPRAPKNFSFLKQDIFSLLVLEFTCIKMSLNRLAEPFAISTVGGDNTYLSYLISIHFLF